MDEASHDIDFYTWNGGTAWSSRTEIEGDCDADTGDHYMFAFNAIVDPNTDDFYLACVDTPTTTSSVIRFWHYDGSWTEQGNIYDGATGIQTDVSLGIDTHTGDLYATYLTGSSVTVQDIVVAQSTDVGVTWSTTANVLTSTAADFIVCTNYTGI